jgi:NHLM bacteriocin system ABC transporter peptidase/ATP-binding protein
MRTAPAMISGAPALPRAQLPFSWLRVRTGLNRSRVARVPTILQMEAVECGAAALAMILAYFGRWVPLEALRVACGVSRDGSKASNVIAAARSYGLAARGFKAEPDQLAKLPIPSIIHWNFNHFVVFEGIAGSWAYINDPATGRHRVSLVELSDSFTGVVLAFETTAGFRREGSRPRALPMLWRLLAQSRSGLTLVLLISMMLVLPGIVAPVFGKLFVDNVLVDRLPGWIGPLLIGLALTAVVRAIILGLRLHYLLRLEVKLGITLATRLFWHILRLPIVFFIQRHAGDVASRIALNEEVSQLLSGELATTALQLITLVFFAGAMASYDLALTATVVPFALFNLIALRLAGRRREDMARRLAKDQGQLAAATVGTIRSVETIKSSGLEPDAFARWAGHHAKAMGATQQLDLYTAKLNVLPPLLTALGNTAVLGLGGLRVMQGAMSIGDLVAFQTLAASFSEPTAHLVALGARLQQIKADLARISDALAYPIERRAAATTTGMNASDFVGSARLQGKIELCDVTFGYNPNEPPLIENLSLTIEPGQRVALVGRSGSGKSTVGRLLCGLYPTWSGEILFDGRTPADLAPKVLAHSIAYVDQDVFLFAGTVRENLTLWDSSVDDARLIRALRDAAIFDELAVRPGILDSRVAEGGRDFSGGQRQRIEIARALALEPSILVLDEATSAVDPLVEEQIDENTRRRGCTCVIIAHRYSTIRDCDQIVVLSDGHVEGCGTHSELVASCPLYADLLRTE